jgi:archaellum component FlaC
MIVEIFLGIVSILFITSCYVIWNLTRKTELLETWVEDFTQLIESVDNELRIIDSTGHFESDDEIGAIFKQIKNTVNQLNRLRGIDVND